MLSDPRQILKATPAVNLPRSIQFAITIRYRMENRTVPQHFLAETNFLCRGLWCTLLVSASALNSFAES